MKPKLRLQSTKSRPGAAITDNKRDVSGLTEQRQQAVRALEETREARQTGEIEKAAAKVVDQLEQGLTGTPEPGSSGVVTARVVASGDSKERQPAVPLAGLTARLKVNEKVVEEKETNPFGLVTLELPKEEAGSYELEILGPSCNVIACQQGRWGPKQSPVGHRIEVGRSEELKPQLERAAMFEEAIKKARERANIARDVVIKALDAQERKLIEYLAEIDDELKCEHPTGFEHTQDSNQQGRSQPETPRQQTEPVMPFEEQSAPQVEGQPSRQADLIADSPAAKSSEEKSKPEEKPKAETNPKGKKSNKKQHRTDKEKKSM